MTKEVTFMKCLTLTILLLGAVILSGSALVPTSVARVSHRETALVEFNDQVKLGTMLLKGRYWFVHDEDKMARGEDCTYVYSDKAGQPDKLLISFHCTPVERKKVDRFTVITSRISTNSMLADVKEIQFAGSDEGHQVPQ
jgi:hypothetical protein